MPHFSLRKALSYILRHAPGTSAIPDKIYLQMLYRLQTGNKLRTENPVTFCEKIQWLKLYGNQDQYTTMVDKAAVKDYVAERIGAEYIIPTIGIWDSFDDIDIDSLPERFVLKTTHGGGSMGVCVCADKKTFDRAKARKMLNKSLSTDIYKAYRERPYRDVPRRILAEEFIEMPGKEDLSDYKIFCFNGRPVYIQLIQDRHSGETIDFYDTEWQLQPFIGLNPAARHAAQPAPRPEGLDKMLEIATTLSAGIPFVRVDLYNINGRILFGELTFYPGSGMGRFAPSEWDTTLGQLIELTK
ncbi:MAG: hypothetical protein K2F97_00700 [Muribaculaceae bacterium]|nr:hypothetical protein [Muribaculaceae bacterium]